MSDDDQPIDSNEFRRALSGFATGVAVVTAIDADGAPTGITINSFNSVSLEPPLVLWSIANSAYSYDAFINAEHFVVNLLTVEQEELATLFAERGGDKFSSLNCNAGLHGVPILPDYVACFECRTEHIYEGGDHKIIVGRVLRFDDRERAPLIFYRSQFFEGGDLYPGDQE